MGAGRYCAFATGYGRSSKPETSDDQAPYSKRAMAADMVAVMSQLGHDRFVVVGHDRGSYVASRLALDHPGAVAALVVCDGVPIAEALARCTDRFARQWWHWFFYAQPDRPERAITADPDAWYGGDPAVMGAEAYEEYRQAIHDPDTVHAMLEDYRAGLGVDRAHDESDRAAGRRVACPMLVVWSRHDDMECLYGDPVEVWRGWGGGGPGGGGSGAGHHHGAGGP